MTHLNEEERHGLADGSLAPEQLAVAESHTRACVECAADVDRIRRLMKRTDESMPRPAATEVDELWGGIKGRIEERKVVPLDGVILSEAKKRVRPLRHRMPIAIGGVIAAGIVALWFTRDRATRVDSPTTVVAVASDSGISMIAAMDSASAYQGEAQALLNRLEVQRATMRPEMSRALERDLKVIDVAIAELQDAIRNDPRNPALRRLLASSYRQKVDLLKRVTNAG